MASNSTWDHVLDLATSQFEEAKPLIPMYIHLIASALFPIYTGAFASLSRPSSAAKPSKLTSPEVEDDEEEEEVEQHMEGLQPSDAIVFPLMAGSVLAGLYFLIKRYGAAIINLVLGWYFAFVGVYSVGTLVNDTLTMLDSIIFPDFYQDQGKVWKIVAKEKVVVSIGGTAHSRISRVSPLPGALGRLPLPNALSSLLWRGRALSKQRYNVKGYLKGVFDFKATLRQHNVLAAVLGAAAVSYATFVAKPWWLTNLQGFGVCYGALQLMSPTTFGTGTLILSGLFFYDIWAVFFTPLMVTVAKNLDVPIKLVFPRPDEPDQDVRSYSMLGLGDIVLPGIMIALALRFDLYVFYLKRQTRSTKDKTGAPGKESTPAIEKAPYVPVTGRWGEKLWTFGASRALLPASFTQSFPKPYFTASMIGYVLGMITTLIAMSLMQHAQPALLYLVPGVLASLWGTALVRGELKTMWEYTEAITGESLDDDKEATSEDDKTGDEEKPLAAMASALFDRSKWIEFFAGKGDAKPATEKKANDTSESKQSDAKSKNAKDEPKAVDPDVMFTLSVTLRPSSKGAASDTIPSMNPNKHSPDADTKAKALSSLQTTTDTALA